MHFVFETGTIISAAISVLAETGTFLHAFCGVLPESRDDSSETGESE
jgi:hypothetical protein